MENQVDKLNERLSFYMKAYDETSSDLKSLVKEKKIVEKEINTEAENILDETVPTPLNNEQIDLLEKEFQMNLDNIVLKHEEIKSQYIKQTEILKSDNRYTEYLNLLINDDLKLVSDMEKNEVFNYLIEQKFNTDEFNNEPYFEILKLKYQPRFWKFRKIANKISTEFGIASFSEMFKLWDGLRINYKSLIGNKKIANVITECEGIENKIKELDKSVVDYLMIRRADIIDTIIQRIKMLAVSVLDTLKFSNLIPLLENFKMLSEKETGLDERKSVIMENTNTVEKMISLAEQGNLDMNDKKYEGFFNNTNPVTPIFELIDTTEWTSIKNALEDKGIKTSDKDNYTVVRTKISSKEKKDLLNKYNVKECEIFIDENLANKRY